MEDIKYFDSHAHYDAKFEDDLDDVINRAYNLGVKKIVDIGYDEKSSLDAINLANRYEHIYSAVGLHPEEIYENSNIDYVKKLVNNKKVVAIGEIGLDYHWDNDREKQKKFFKEQVEFANYINLPIVIHNREADMDILHILKNEVKPKVDVVFHCFSSSYEIAKEVLKHDWYISLSGTVTFKNARNLHEVAQKVPLEKLMIETDSPYLSPEPNRGKRNDSSNVIYVCEKIANLRNMNKSEIAKITYDNACRFYNIEDKDE